MTPSRMCLSALKTVPTMFSPSSMSISKARTRGCCKGRLRTPLGWQSSAHFLSHIRQERHLVGDVKRRLEGSYGIDAFVAHDDIHPSKTWREQIKTALASCHLFVAFLHDGFHASQWCDQEVDGLSRGESQFSR
jgi:hypothetical protein